VSAALEVAGLCKRYGDVGVLDGVSFRVAEGEIVAIVGANGSGKSTLLRCCLGLLRAEAGSVRLLGHDLSRLRGRRLRRLRGSGALIWQRHHLVPRLSALANVMHGAQARSDDPRLWFRATSPAWLRAEALAALDAVHLAPLAERRVDRLSGGESQRVAIARALVQRPRLLFADEPVASLDPRVSAEVMELLIGKVRALGLTLVFVSHDVRGSLAHASRVIGLRGGKVELYAPAERLTPAHLRSFYD